MYIGGVVAVILIILLLIFLVSPRGFPGGRGGARRRTGLAPCLTHPRTPAADRVTRRGL